MYNPGNKAPRRKPGSRPRTYRDLYNQNHIRPSTAAGTMNLPALQDGEPQQIPRVASAPETTSRGNVKPQSPPAATPGPKNEKEKSLVGQQRQRQQHPSAPVTESPPNSSRRGGRNVNDSSRPNHRQIKSEARSESGLAPPGRQSPAAAEHQSMPILQTRPAPTAPTDSSVASPSTDSTETVRHESSSRVITSKIKTAAKSDRGLAPGRKSPAAVQHQSMPILQTRPAPTIPPVAPPPTDSTETIWHDTVSSHSVIAEADPGVGRASSERVFPAQVSHRQNNNVNEAPPAPAPRRSTVKYSAREVGFDLGDHYKLDDDSNDNDTDEEEEIFGSTPYDKQIREKENILEVSNKMTFSPFNPRPIRNWYKAKTWLKSCPEPPGCFKSQIKIRNTSKFNMTYQIKSSSRKMFRISSPIGFILPGCTKDIVVLTNPKINYEYEEIADCAFVVQGHPILFRERLLPEVVDAFWRAIDCGILPVENMETHNITWIRPSSDGILSMHNGIARVRLLWPFGGNEVKVENPNLPPIDLNAFNKIWYSDDPSSRVLQLKFRNRQLSRKLVRREQERTNEKQLIRGLCVVNVLTVLTYGFVGFLLYSELYPYFKPAPPPTWYESTYGSVKDGVVSGYNAVENFVCNACQTGWGWISKLW